MRTERWKAFWASFFLTLLIMTPGLAAAIAAVEWQPQSAAQSQTGIPVRYPKGQHRLTLLAVVADEQPAFMLVRLDATEDVFSLAALPGQSVVKTETGGRTLTEAYAAAGPARAARLLTETLAVPIDRYLAATPESWAAILEQAGPVRVGLAGALTPDQQKAAGLAEGMESWSIASARDFLVHLDGMPEAVPPTAAAAARAALWQGWARQKLEQLPRLLPDGLRDESSRLLTDLTGTELLTLEETLEFLADAQVQPQVVSLPGRWDEESGRYEFEEETLSVVQAAFSSPASAGASASGSVP